MAASGGASPQAAQPAEVLAELEDCRVMGIAPDGSTGFPAGTLMCIRTRVPDSDRTTGTAAAGGPVVVALVCGSEFFVPLCGQPCLRLGPGTYLLSGGRPGCNFHLRVSSPQPAKLRAMDASLAAFTVLKSRASGQLISVQQAVAGELDAPAAPSSGAPAATAALPAAASAPAPEGAPPSSAAAASAMTAYLPTSESLTALSAYVPSAESLASLSAYVPTAQGLADAQTAAWSALGAGGSYVWSAASAAAADVAAERSSRFPQPVVAAPRAVEDTSSALGQDAALAGDSNHPASSASASSTAAPLAASPVTSTAASTATSAPVGPGTGAGSSDGPPAEGVAAAGEAEDEAAAAARAEAEEAAAWATVSGAVSAAGQWTAAGLVVFARYLGVGVQQAAQLLVKAVPAATEDAEVSPATMERIRSARQVSSSVVLVSRRVASSLGSMAVGLGRAGAGMAKAWTADGAATSASVRGATSLGLAGAEALGSVWESLEEAAGEVGTGFATAAERVADHSYGRQVAAATREGLAVGGDATRAVMSMRSMGVTSLAVQATRAAAQADGEPAHPPRP
ncbi:hypothetical protein FNF27_02557 [Cafeteria roenbergensis]|uniref:Senescence domain-containing protein n=2 Tax=Cafeteria roenbergensis TaxID=33653 RepID=A0A5A8EDE5_CAFRO|nr:hypothetical protein FNF27_02557 [Cafeteria roenbergensis]